MPRRLLLLCAVFYGALALEPEYAGIYAAHDEGAGNFYHLTLSNTNEAHVKVAFLPAANTLEATLNTLEPEGEHALDETCVEIENLGSMTPEMDKCFFLHLDYPVNIFKVAGDSAFAFFAEHDLTELTVTGVPAMAEAHSVAAVHILDEDAHDHAAAPPAAPPSAAAGTKKEKDKRWGDAIGAGVLINLCTLLGVFFLALSAFPFMQQEKMRNILQVTLLSFSGGAILSCALFLILLEASHLVAIGHVGEDETETTWRWGAMVLAGFTISWMLQFAVSLLMDTGEKHSATASAVKPTDGSKEMKPIAVEDVSRGEKLRIFFATFLGDGMHNLVDGFVVGTAFTYCSSGLAWSIAGTTIAHEIAQELGDYFTLTVRAGLKPWLALLLNFVTGLSVFLGIIIVLAGDPSHEARGLLLAFGGGTYLHISTIECMSVVYAQQLPRRQTMGVMLAFIVGAVAIGLVLLDHQHCSTTVESSAAGAAGAAADPHAGHGH